MEDHNSEASSLQHTEISITIQTQADHRSELKIKPMRSQGPLNQLLVGIARNFYFTNQLN